MQSFKPAFFLCSFALVGCGDEPPAKPDFTAELQSIADSSLELVRAPGMT